VGAVPAGALAHKLTGGASTLLEWDAKIPEFPVVHAEVLKAKHYMSERLSPAPAAAPAPVAGPSAVSNPMSFLVAGAAHSCATAAR
jgi:uncharacterized protein